MTSLNLGEKEGFKAIEGLSAYDIIEFFRNGKIKLFCDDLDKIEKCRCGKRAYFFWLQLAGSEFMKVDYSLIFLCKDCYEMVKRAKSKTEKANK